jgi:hypothetical protein
MILRLPRRCAPRNDIFYSSELEMAGWDLGTGEKSVMIIRVTGLLWGFLELTT